MCRLFGFWLLFSVRLAHRKDEYQLLPPFFHSVPVCIFFFSTGAARGDNWRRPGSDGGGAARFCDGDRGVALVSLMLMFLVAYCSRLLCACWCATSVTAFVVAHYAEPFSVVPCCFCCVNCVPALAFAPLMLSFSSLLPPWGFQVSCFFLAFISFSSVVVLFLFLLLLCYVREIVGSRLRQGVRFRVSIWNSSVSDRQTTIFLSISTCWLLLCRPGCLSVQVVLSWSVVCLIAPHRPVGSDLFVFVISVFLCHCLARVRLVSLPTFLVYSTCYDGLFGYGC